MTEWFRPWQHAECQRPLARSRAAHDADHAALRRLARNQAASHAGVLLLVAPLQRQL